MSPSDNSLFDEPDTFDDLDVSLDSSDEPSPRSALDLPPEKRPLKILQWWARIRQIPHRMKESLIQYISKKVEKAYPKLVALNRLGQRTESVERSSPYAPMPKVKPPAPPPVPAWRTTVPPRKELFTEPKQHIGDVEEQLQKVLAITEQERELIREIVKQHEKYM